MEKKYRKHDILYALNSSVNKVYFIRDGEITLYYKHYGKKIIIDSLKSGTFFGSLDVKKNIIAHSAQATKDVVLYEILQQDLLSVIDHNPSIMKRLIQILATRLDRYENKLRSLIYDAKEKILHQMEILEERKHRYQNTFLSSVMTRASRVTHAKISHYTGLSRETVTRAIQDLKREGKIIIDEQERIQLNCKDCIPESKASFRSL